MGLVATSSDIKESETTLLVRLSAFFQMLQQKRPFIGLFGLQSITNLMQIQGVNTWSPINKTDGGYSQLQQSVGGPRVYQLSLLSLS